MARYPTFEEYDATGRHKDGLKKINDILKRTAKPDAQLLTTKLQFLYALKQDDEASQLLQQLELLQPAIQDPDDMALLEEIVYRHRCRDVYPLPVTAGTQLDELWDRAMKATTSQQDKQLLLHNRLIRAVFDKRWSDAQKASIGLKASNPQNRVFYLAHVAITQLLSESGGSDDIQRQTQGRLAFAFAQKAQQSKFADDRSLDCGAIQHVYKRQHRWEDLLKITTNDEHYQQKIMCLRELGRSDELAEYCSRLIERDNAPDAGDWAVWKGVTEGPRPFKLLRQTRESRLAQLQTDRSAELIMQYFKTYGGEKHLFGDLRITLERLGADDGTRGTLYEDMSSTAESMQPDASDWMAWEVNRLKVRYFLHVVSRAVADRHQTITSFTTHLIRLFDTGRSLASKRMSWTVDDACLIAVSSLLQLANAAPNDLGASRYTLQAALLLETLLRYNAEVYQAKVCLVHIYMKLDLGALALKHFKTLKVREIQHDTISHSVMTHLSVIHPHPTRITSGKATDPWEMAGVMLQVYNLSDHKLARAQAETINNGQTSMLFDLNDLRDALHGSITRRILSIERRRIARLTQRSLKHNDAHQIFPRTVKHWTTVKDSRDFNATFDFGVRGEELIDPEPVKESWIVISLVLDVIWSLLDGQDAPCLIGGLQEAIQTASDVHKGVSASELLVGRVAVELLPAVLELQAQHIDTERVEAIQSALNLLADNTLAGEKIGIRDAYTTIDVLRLVAGYCDAAARPHNKSGISSLAQLETKVAEHFRVVQQLATKEKNSCKPDSVLGVVDSGDELSKTLQEVAGRESVLAFAKAVSDATREGWDGVTRIKLR